MPHGREFRKPVCVRTVIEGGLMEFEGTEQVPFYGCLRGPDLLIGSF